MPTVSYPTLDKPPAYESSGDNVGTLIDLGVDLGPTPAVPPQTMGGDILGQLADLGTVLYTQMYYMYILCL